MASSDDESETLPQTVTNYHFIDGKDEPICFSVLPVHWGGGQNPDSTAKKVFLNGVADDGIQKIFKQVTAWKFDLSGEEPEISVLSREKNWIKLLKPRKSFADTVRAVLITVHCLHFVKNNPDAVWNSVWDRLWKVFSSYEVRPYEKDLLDQLPLIRSANKHDELLSKSKFLMTFLENPTKRKVLDEDAHAGIEAPKSKFIVDDDEELVDGSGAAADEGSDEDEDEDDYLFDSVCAFCDNGGELLCCEGRCIRSFHPTLKAGEESECTSLGLSNTQVKAIQNFMCLNCKYMRHQCFACGKLGSSDKSSGAAEVFHCVSATCGYFYHPHCVAKLLHSDAAEAEDFERRISGGESFTCPVHKCYKCKLGEDKDVEELQFAVCRRCPKAYHRKCLPRKIAFEDNEEEGIITRAWDGLLPNNRVLIYCLKHEIDEDLGTPIRNHIIFPRTEEKKKTHPLDQLVKKRKAASERRYLDPEDSPSERMEAKVPKHASSTDVKHKDSLIKREKSFAEKKLGFPEKPKIPSASKQPLQDGINSDKSSMVAKSRVSAGDERLNRSVSFQSKEKKVTSGKLEGTGKHSIPRKRQPVFQLDPETKNRLKSMMEETSSSITLEDIVKSHKVPSTHAYSSKGVVDKSITQGKVEGFVEAIRTALQKLENGGSVEDAKAVCGPEIISQIIKWKNKLKVYLAPFLHGMRYTSFGRHFTKVDKLKEIVDKLHWYTQNGDTIVDFCCGANDFSWLMKQKLEEIGKRCSFKNFDVIQPKNDFNFEKRDWMTVRPNELPKGSNLIMGLNPPFGVKASLANKFIDKALQFKPKLLILIVPPETERLDRKRPPYDLIWEDNAQLSGKSFYLPGSVDVNDNQMEQWNVTPPPLYLWSRSDWTAQHRAIAVKQGHFPNKQKEFDVDQTSHHKAIAVNQGHFPKEQKEFNVEDKNDVQIPEDMDISPIRDADREVNHNKNLAVENDESGAHEVSTHHTAPRLEIGDHQTSNGGKNRKRQKNKKKRSGSNRDRLDKGNESMNTTGMKADPREDQPAEAFEGHSDRGNNEDAVEHLQPVPRVDDLEHRTRHGDPGSDIRETLDDISRRYSSDGIPIASGVTNWSTGAGQGSEYGVRGLDVQFAGYANDGAGAYGLSAYANEQLDDYSRDTLRRYGGANPGSLTPSSQYLGLDAGYTRLGSLPSTTYRHPGLAPDSSSSAMQRYAPRLDELNYSRLSSVTPQSPPVRGSSVFNNIASQYPPGSMPGIHPHSSGFAPGLPYPPSNHQKNGWID